MSLFAPLVQAPLAELPKRAVCNLSMLSKLGCSWITLANTKVLAYLLCLRVFMSPVTAFKKAQKSEIAAYFWLLFFQSQSGTGIWHCGETVIKEEGARALWKGLTPFAVHLTLKYALRMGTNATYQSLLRDEVCLHVIMCL